MITKTSEGQAENTRYVDRKRRVWILSLIVPAIVGLGPLLYEMTGLSWTLWIPIAFYYAAIPLLDFLLGRDPSNPPESEVPRLEADPYYRRITFALVPILWGFFLAAAAFVGTRDLPWHGILAMAMTAGLICGFGLNLGHELGHKKSTLERWLARIVLSLGAYGHFSIEHNRGHHRDVATPEDPASSRMGESIYRFARRELPGGLRRAWRLESERLTKRGLKPWSRHNEILQTALISLLLYSALLLAFGWVMLPYLSITILFGAFQLTSANYIEHYGLLRQRRPDGRYEKCQPQHSWNSNHIFSNWALFHLQRHSDHHANPARRYQSLRHFEAVPQLPNGYAGMYVIAYIPWLWFRIMDKRLLSWVGGDLDRVNLDPSRNAALRKRYGHLQRPIAAT